MGIGDLVKKVRKALSGHGGQAKADIEKGADAIKSTTDDETDVKIDQAVEKAKDAIDGDETAKADTAVKTAKAESTKSTKSKNDKGK